jgi:hypothetical protein
VKHLTRKRKINKKIVKIKRQWGHKSHTPKIQSMKEACLVFVYLKTKLNNLHKWAPPFFFSFSQMLTPPKNTSHLYTTSKHIFKPKTKYTFSKALSNSNMPIIFAPLPQKKWKRKKEMKGFVGVHLIYFWNFFPQKSGSNLWKDIGKKGKWKKWSKFNVQRFNDYKLIEDSILTLTHGILNNSWCRHLQWKSLKRRRNQMILLERTRFLLSLNKRWGFLGIFSFLQWSTLC